MHDSNRVPGPQEADICCPQCQHKQRETLGRLQADPHVTCPACHTVMRFDLTQREAKVARAGRGDGLG